MNRDPYSIDGPPQTLAPHCERRGCFVAETKAISDHYRLNPPPYEPGGTFYSEPRIEPDDPPRSGFAVLVYVVAGLGVALLIGYVVLHR